jgi:predicted metal-dependent hydrolase
MKNAKRMRLRVDHRAGLIRLTVPARASGRAALRWAGEQRAWVEGQLASAPAGQPLEPGAVIPFEGKELLLVPVEGTRRGVQRDGGRLLVGGPAASLARVVERWLKQEALERLSQQTAAIAALAGVTVSSVAIGDPVSRWGSCTSAGAIRYSWRLVLAPPDALRFVVAHEVAHRLHLDHGPQFKAAEQRLFGAPVAPARALLREVAPALRAVGRR